MRDIDENSYTGRRRLLVINPTVVEVSGLHIYTALRLYFTTFLWNAVHKFAAYGTIKCYCIVLLYCK